MVEKIILVVDDDVYIREIVTLVLEMDGYRIVAVCDGSEALAYLDTNRVDMILSDVHMPIMDGWSLIRALRAQQVATPVILMSAVLPEVAQADTPSEFISKPFTLSVLRAIVAQCFAAHVVSNIYPVR